MKMYLGTSDWNYDEWRGVFYPVDLAKSEYLSYFTKSFNSVELGATFFRFPFHNFIRAWFHRSPEEFTFSVKMNWKITHKNKFSTGEPNKKIMADFFRRIEIMKPKIKRILIEIPPKLAYNIETIREFFQILPKDYEYAIEAKNTDWNTPEFIAMCAENSIIPVGYDKPSSNFYPEYDGCKTLYFKFYGRTVMNQYLYSEEELQNFADKVKAHNYDEIYVYFANFSNGYALENLRTLTEMLK